MFAYYFTPAAEKEIGGLPKRFQRQIFDAVEAVCRFSHPLKSTRVIKLKGYAAPTYRLRSGDYRIIFRILNDALVIGSVRNRQEGY